MVTRYRGNDGKTYKVEPEDLEQFLKDNDQAVIMPTLGDKFVYQQQDGDTISVKPEDHSSFINDPKHKNSKLIRGGKEDYVAPPPTYSISKGGTSVPQSKENFKKLLQDPNNNYFEQIAKGELNATVSNDPQTQAWLESSIRSYKINTDPRVGSRGRGWSYSQSKVGKNIKSRIYDAWRYINPTVESKVDDKRVSNDKMLETFNEDGSVKSELLENMASIISENPWMEGVEPSDDSSFAKKLTAGPEKRLKNFLNKYFEGQGVVAKEAISFHDAITLHGDGWSSKPFNIYKARPEGYGGELEIDFGQLNDMMQEVKRNSNPDLAHEQDMELIRGIGNSSFLNSVNEFEFEAALMQELDSVFNPNISKRRLVDKPTTLTNRQSGEQTTSWANVGVDRDGFVQLEDGTRLSYKYIWDNRDRLYEKWEAISSGANGDIEEATYGGPSGVDDYLELVDMVSHGKEPADLKKIKREIENIENGFKTVFNEDTNKTEIVELEDGDINGELERLEIEKNALIEKLGIRDLIGEDGKFTNVKRLRWVFDPRDETKMIQVNEDNVPTGESKKASDIEIKIEQDAKDLAVENHIDFIKEMRRKAYYRFLAAGQYAWDNRGQMEKEIRWIDKQFAKVFDPSNDSYANDIAQLEKVFGPEGDRKIFDVKIDAQNPSSEIWGFSMSDETPEFFTNFGGGSKIAKNFNDALTEYKMWSRAVDLNIDPRESDMENLLFGVNFNLKNLKDAKMFGGDKTLFPTKDSYNSVITTGHGSTLVDGLGKAFFGGTGGLKDITSDDMNQVFEHKILESGIYQLPDIRNEGWSGRGNKRREIANLATNTVTSLAPLLAEIAVFKKVGGLKALNKTFHGLARAFTKNSNSKMYKKFVHNVVVPGFVTPLEWSMAEYGGEVLLADGSGMFDAHTFHIDKETGEIQTNFLFPMAMGMSGGLFGLGTKGFQNKILKPIINKEGGPGGQVLLYLDKMKNKNLAGSLTLGETGKTLGKWTGQGATATGLLTVASSVEQMKKDFDNGWWPWTHLDPESSEGKARKEEWDSFTTMDHFIATTVAMMAVGWRGLGSIGKDIKTDFLRIKTETIESKAADKGLGMSQKNEKNEDGTWETKDIKREKDQLQKLIEVEKDPIVKELEDLRKQELDPKTSGVYDAVNGKGALEKKVNELNEKIDKLNKDNKNIENWAAELFRRNEIIETKKGLKSEKEYIDYLKAEWNIARGLGDGQLKADDLDRIADLNAKEFEMFLENEGIKGDRADYLKSVYGVVSQSGMIATKLKMGERGSNTRDLWMESQYELAHNLNNIKNLKEAAKQGSSNEAIYDKQIKQLENRNKELNERLDKQFEKHNVEFKKELLAQLKLDKKLAEKIGVGFEIVDQKKYEEVLKKSGEDVNAGKFSEAFISKLGDKIYINMNQALKVKNLGVGRHEIMHKLLWDTLKESYTYKDPATGKKETRRRVSEDGMKIIDLVLGKLYSKDRKLIKDRVEQNYMYETDYRTVVKNGKKVIEEFYVLKDGERIKKDPKEYYEEYLTATVDAIKNKQLIKDYSTGRQLGTVLWPIMKERGPYKNMYKFEINGVNSKKAVNDLWAMIETLTKESDVSVGMVVSGGKIKGVGGAQSRSNVEAMVVKHDGNPAKMLRKELNRYPDSFAKREDGSLILDSQGRKIPVEGAELDWSRHEYPINESSFGKEVGPIVGNILKRLYDPITRYPSGKEALRDLGITREQFKNELILRASSLIDRGGEFRREDLGKGQTIDDFISNRLNLRANSLAKELGLPSAETLIKKEKFEQKSGEDVFERQVGVEDRKMTDFENQQIQLKETTKKEISQFRKDFGIKDGTAEYNVLKEKAFNATLNSFKKSKVNIVDAEGNVNPKFTTDLKQNVRKEVMTTVKKMFLDGGKNGVIKFTEKYGKMFWENYVMKTLDGKNWIVKAGTPSKAILKKYPDAKPFGREVVIDRASVSTTKAAQGMEQLRKTASTTAGTTVYRVKTWEEINGNMGLQALLNGEYYNPKTKETVQAEDIIGFSGKAASGNYFAGKRESVSDFLVDNITKSVIDQVRRENKIEEINGEKVVEGLLDRIVNSVGGKVGVDFSKSTEFNIDHARELLKDIWENGLGDVIKLTDTGELRLIRDYGNKNISQETIDKVHSIWDVSPSTSNSMKFISGIKNHKNPLMQEIADAFKTDRFNRNDLQTLGRIERQLPEVVKALGKDVLQMKPLWDMLGFHRRILNSAQKQKWDWWETMSTEQKDIIKKEHGGDVQYQKTKDGKYISAPYFKSKQKLINLANTFKSEPKIKKLVEKVKLMNKGVGGPFKVVENILNRDITQAEKILELKKIEKEIVEASEANIELHTEIINRLTKGVIGKKFDASTVAHILQAQTSLVKGFRALSRLELVDVRTGSQATYRYKVKTRSGKVVEKFTNNLSEAKKGVSHNINKRNPWFKQAVKWYGSEAVVLEMIEKGKLGIKGEHLGPSALTNIKLVEFIMEATRSNKYSTDKARRARIKEILTDHSQLITAEYVTDIIDKGGKTNPAGFDRVKFLDQYHSAGKHVDNIFSFSGKNYYEFLTSKKLSTWEKKNGEKAVEHKERLIRDSKIVDSQIKYSKSGEKRGMSTFDFDETLIIKGKNFVTAKNPKTGVVKKISSEAWPVESAKLIKEGYEFDFNDFVNVKGGVDGPLLQKMKNQIEKYGSDNVFVLTARPPQSAIAILGWLKSKGVKIPIENITGLGDGTGKAKAEWMLNKFSEGYNDMYFVDDALPNVKAVKDVLNQLDIKSSVVQAKNKIQVGKYIVDMTTKEGRRFVENYETKPGKKVIFLAGGAGSGKSNVINKLKLRDQGFEIVNQDISLEWLKKQEGIPENMRELSKEEKSKLGKISAQARGIASRKMEKFKGKGDGIIVDGTGGSIKNMEKLFKEFKDKGYDTSMLFVEASLNTALNRNKLRKERSLLDGIVKKNYESVQKNKSGFKSMFKESFMEVKTDNLKKNDLMPIELVSKINEFVGRQKDLKLGKELPDWIVDMSTKKGRELIQNLEGLPIIKGGELSKVQFSKSIDVEFNEMIERRFKVDAIKNISGGVAKIKGRNIGKWSFFVPPSAEDFSGLMYSMLGKGKQGDADMAWFKKNLFDPFAVGVRDLTIAKQKMSEEYKELTKQTKKDVKLNKKIEGTEYTNDVAIRTYLWEKGGHEIPGMKESTKNMLLDYVTSNPKLVKFAETLESITRLKKGYEAPGEYWMLESISSDLNNLVRGTTRSNFLSKWIENKKVIFSEKNLNKIESVLGSRYREALENMLYRMEHGTNRLIGTKDGPTKDFYDWINGSVGATMFINVRSSVLQTISMVNFINHKDNSIFAASKAFANQPQFWKDFSFIMNSPMLKQRRAGLEIDVSASELTNVFQKSGKNPRSILKYILEKGFTPTKLADSFAIAMGGAPFYRNRLNMYLKQGMAIGKAKEKAWLDFQEIAEQTQQSSRPDLISQQQAGPLGRIILAWANTPMQMTRLMKKSMADLVNRRGDWRNNVSKILYYGAIQNLWFMTLQTGLGWMMFGTDQEEAIEKKEQRVLNGAFDTVLRGTGVYGAAAATLKNVILQAQAELGKESYKRDLGNVAIEMINLSPPLGAKSRKMYQALKTFAYNDGVGKELGFRIENPNINAIANVIEATTNAPTARILNMSHSMEEVITGGHAIWQDAAMTLGWSMWNVGAKDIDLEVARESAKEKREIQKKKEKEIDKRIEKMEKENAGLKEKRCSGRNSEGRRCKLTGWTKSNVYKCRYHR